MHVDFLKFYSISGAEQQIVDDYVCRHPDHTPSTNVLVQASGKLVLIDKLLPKLKANGHKVCTANAYVPPLVYYIKKFHKVTCFEIFGYL